MRRGPAVILLLSLLIASGFGARRAVLEGWSRLNGFAPSHLHATRPTAGPAPLTGRLVLIMIDGLRTDDTAHLPVLDMLSRQGSHFRLTAPAPAFPGPVTASILTGAPPVLHGYVLPPVRATGVDSLPAAATRARITTGGAGSPTLGTLFGPSLTSWAPVDSPAALLTQTQPLLASTGPRLVILELDQLHKGSQKLQSPSWDTPAYRDLLGDLDATLVQILQQIDLKATTVMVTGIMPTGPDGSHVPGGEVPLIVTGPGVKAGASSTGSLLDVAPTAAAFLGAPTPLQNQGRPLMAAMAVDGRPADVVAQRWLEARKLLTDAELRSYGASDPVPDPPPTLQEADSYMTTLDGQVSQARFAYWKRIVPARLPYVAGATVLLFIYLLVVFFQRFGGPVFAGTLVYGAAFHLIFFLTGGRYSAAMAGLEAMDLPFMLKLSARVAAALLLAGGVTGAMLARRGFKKSAYLTTVSLHFALTTAVALSLPLIVGLTFVLYDFPVQLPAPGLLVWYFLTALQVMVIGFLSPIWAIVTVAATRIAQRIWPPAAAAPEPTGKGPSGSGAPGRGDGPRRRPRLADLDSPGRPLKR